MIKLKIKNRVSCEFECVLSDSYRALDLLRMLSSINEDEIYSVENIEIETDKNVLGKKYEVRDNSFCINLENGKESHLLQVKDEHYVPNEDEDGAKFIIVKNPYVKKVCVPCVGNFYMIFVNVMSTKTGKFYRVTYNENSVGW